MDINNLKWYHCTVIVVCIGAAVVYYDKSSHNPNLNDSEYSGQKNNNKPENTSTSTESAVDLCQSSCVNSADVKNTASLDVSKYCDCYCLHMVNGNRNSKDVAFGCMTQAIILPNE